MKKFSSFFSDFKSKIEVEYSKKKYYFCFENKITVDKKNCDNKLIYLLIRNQ